MAELTLEQQQAIARARARRRRAEAEAGEQAQTEGPGGGMSFFNKLIAEGAGAPVDLISAGLSKIGIDAPEGGAFGGSQVSEGVWLILAHPLQTVIQKHWLKTSALWAARWRLFFYQLLKLHK